MRTESLSHLTDESRVLSEGSKGSLEYELRGKTLEVYVTLFKHGSDLGVREIQKELGFSSPSVAFDHLKRLVDLGVVEKDVNDRYVLTKKVDTGILQLFSTIAGLTFPRLGFYAIFFSFIAAAYLVFDRGSLDPFALVGTLGVATALWYEASRVWRRSPF